MVPDADGHLLSFGIGYAKNNFTIDLASMVLLIQDRHTRRNIDGLNGKYTSTGVNFLFSTTYHVLTSVVFFQNTSGISFISTSIFQLLQLSRP